MEKEKPVAVGIAEIMRFLNIRSRTTFSKYRRNHPECIKLVAGRWMLFI